MFIQCQRIGMTNTEDDDEGDKSATKNEQSKRRWARVQRRELIAFVIIIGMLVVTAAQIVVYLFI
jgi:hypothetical protein